MGTHVVMTGLVNRKFWGPFPNSNAAHDFAKKVGEIMYPSVINCTEKEVVGKRNFNAKPASAYKPHSL